MQVNGHLVMLSAMIELPAYSQCRQGKPRDWWGVISKGAVDKRRLARFRTIYAKMFACGHFCK